MSKYLKNISLRLFFSLLGLLSLLTAADLWREEQTAFLYGGASLIILSALAWWLARSITRITRYSEDMAAGRPAQPPRFGDSYLRRLTAAITHLRDELNHKQYIENYVLGLTHELKTPLTAQQAALELLSDSALNAEQQALLQRIQRSTTKQQQLITRLLQLARLENRDTLERKEPISLGSIIQQAVQDAASTLAGKQLTIAQHGSFSLSGDALLIRQAIDNLLYNAIEFADSGSTIRITTADSAVRIHNRGAPIAAYALAKIPQRFFSTPRADGRRSSGLGLTFTAEIMRLHRGKLSLHNEEDGVTAVLQFPAQPQ